MKTRSIIHERVPLFCLVAALSGCPPLHSEVIPPEQARQDVFGVRLRSVALVEAPAGGQRTRIIFDGLAGADYQVFGSGNLVTWSMLGAVTATGGSGMFEDAGPLPARRFYAVLHQPDDDSTPPAWPAGAAITVQLNGFIHVDLDWAANLATDETGIVAYALYLDGRHRATLGPGESTAFVDGLTPNTLHRLDIVACDAGGNCTQLPQTLTLRTRTQQEPYLHPPVREGVSMANGEFILNRTDFAIPARELSAVFTRTYRSDWEHSGPLGYGWTANVFERLLERRDGTVVWIQGTGRADAFVRLPSGDYTAPAGHFAMLQKTGDDFRLTSADGTLRRFDLAGRILSITSRFGNTVTYQYTAGRLTAVRDDLNRALSFHYSIAGTLAYIADFTGREVRFTYDAAGNLAAARSPVVTGTPNSNDFPDGKVERYIYDYGGIDVDLHNMVQVVAPNESAGLTPRHTIVYGSSPQTHDRVVSFTTGGINATGVPAGGTTALDYTPDPLRAGLILRTSVMDRRLFQQLYDFDPAGRLTQQTEVLADRPDPVTSFTYNADGNILGVTRPEGNVITYTYDSAHPSRRSQGNVLNVTRTPGPRGADQAQITASFTYEPAFNQVRTASTFRGLVYTNGFDFEEGCDFATIGAKIGLSAAAAQSLLQGAGMCLTPAGDLNGDALTNQSDGNVIRTAAPAATLFAGGRQAAAEGDDSQDCVAFYLYDPQRIIKRRVDPEQNVTTFEYYPASDPDGDGNINDPAGDPLTGGYLRRVTEDTQSAAGRNSGVNSAPVLRRHEYQYNPRGAVTSITGPRGVVTAVTRNQLDQPVQMKRAASLAPGFVPNPSEPPGLMALEYLKSSSYDANNNLVRVDVEDRGDTSNTGGLVTTMRQYDILDRLLSVEEEIDAATTRLTRIRYCPDGNRALLILPEGNAVTWRYDERDLLIAQTTGALTPPPEAQAGGPMAPFNPRGGTPSTVRWLWGDNGNLASFTDAADTDGSAANNGPGGGDVTTFSYDGYDRRVSSIDPAGNRTTLQYDANGNVTRAEQFGPNGGATPVTNTPQTNLLTRKGFVYDQRDRCVQANRLLFSASLPGADLAEGAASLGKGNLVPGDGAVNARFEYDRIGRLTAQHEDDGDVTAWQYDGAGRMLRVTDAAGNQIEYACDDAGNVIETRERDAASGAVAADEFFLTTMFHDALDRPVMTVNNLGHTTRYAYDSRDNLTAVSDGNGPNAGAIFARRFFPNAATTVNTLNSHGNVTYYTYDGLNRMITNQRTLTVSGFGNGTLTPVADSGQGGGDGLITTQTIYDRNGLVTARLDDNLFRTGYSYDNLNRLITETHGACAGPALIGYVCDPATGVQFTYDADGNVVTKTDEAANVFAHTYDALNRHLRTDITRGPGVGGVTLQTFAYDGLGRRTESTDNSLAGSVLFFYDSLSRTVRETTEIPGTGTFHTDSAWRGGNLRSGVIYPASAAFTFAYDAGDRITRISDSNGTVADYTYIGMRLREEIFPGGRRNSHAGGYDGLRRPVHVETTNPLGGTLLSFDYTWDRAANRLTGTKNHDPANSEVYQYDSASRLVRFTRPGPGAAAPLHSQWQLDGGGNWKSVDGTTRTITSFNEIASVTPPGSVAAPMTSDDNGNLTSNPLAPGGARTCQFDAFNRLISAQVAGGPALAYSYDAPGRRLTERDGAARSVVFLHDGNHVVVDYDANGSLRGTPGTPGQLREFVIGPGTDRPARMRNAAGAQFYYHRNSLGSVCALTPATGPGAELIRYEAYGTQTVTQTGGLAPTGNPLLFTGQRRCFSTGLYYCGARHYDASLGRFISRAPPGAWGDPYADGNAYTRGASNPVNRTDPDGRFTMQLVYQKVVWSVSDWIPVLQDNVMGGTPRLNGKYYLPGVSHRFNGDTGTHEVGHYQPVPGFTTGDGEVACQQAYNYGPGTILVGESARRGGTAGDANLARRVLTGGWGWNAMHLVPRPSGETVLGDIVVVKQWD